jgi:ABC-type transport system involved in multi-copper enzyme maturation permease subunit
MQSNACAAVLGLARLTLLEARRTAVGKAALAAIAIAVSLALFVDRIVLTDQERATVVTYAVIVRLAIVLILGHAIIANTMRDLNERIIDNFLALPLTRMQYVLGKWLGWTLVAVLCALSAGLPLFGFTSTPGRLPWTLSFAAEAVVVASLALVLALALGRIVTAVFAFCCLYLFARVSSMLVLLSVNMGANHGSLLDRFDARYVEFAGYLLPRMDRFAETAWLSGGPIRFGPDLLQGAIYVVLLGAVAHIELRRKQF